MSASDDNWDEFDFMDFKPTSAPSEHHIIASKKQVYPSNQSLIPLPEKPFLENYEPLKNIMPKEPIPVNPHKDHPRTLSTLPSSSQSLHPLEILGIIENPKRLLEVNFFIPIEQLELEPQPALEQELKSRTISPTYVFESSSLPH